MAADVSPVDVISHIPILCEKKKTPYVFIKSREALGTASQTKRPTSVVMLLKPAEDNKYREQYDKLLEVVRQLNPYVNE
jgi:H/ACA ribonucleoprotein complex subunit 2